MIHAVKKPVKSPPKRRYDASRRQAAALQTRHVIAVAARDLFIERDIVRQVGAEPDPRRIIDLFAHTIRLLQERVAPLIVVLSDGARTDPDLKLFADELSSRQVGHMRAFVA